MRSQPRRRSVKRLNGFRGFGATASGAIRNSGAHRAIEEIEKDKRGWLRHGIAALAISGLGLGIAAAVAVNGSADEAKAGAALGVTAGHAGPSTAPSAAVPSTAATAARNSGTSRSEQRPELDGKSTGTGEPLDGTVDMTARRDAQRNAKVTYTGQQQDADAVAAAKVRAEALKSTADKTQKLSTKLTQIARAEHIRAAKARAAAAAIVGDGRAHLPVNPGQYTIAASFGQVGSWARYHTGVDFAAPIGTPIHATANGVITNAGIGPASAWAGNYVVIKFGDGEQMLFAHMSSVVVGRGQHVTGGQLIGRVGMTGRAFGPHTHVELYPAGKTPGDIYSAINPVPWFTVHGVHP